MVFQTAYNATDHPVAIDEDGRTLGGREWGSVKSDSVQVIAAVAAQHLKIINDVGKGADVDAAAQAAFEQTQKLNGSTQGKTAKERD